MSLLLLASSSTRDIRPFLLHIAVCLPCFLHHRKSCLPAKDDGCATLRQRQRIKILLTVESEFHFKVEFNYIRACLILTPAPPSRFLISSPVVHGLSLLLLFLSLSHLLLFLLTSSHSFHLSCFTFSFSSITSSSLLLHRSSTMGSSRGLRSSMKIFKFHRLAQRKLLLSSAHPAATPQPLFARHFASYPRLNYIPLATIIALFTTRTDIQMP